MTKHMVQYPQVCSHAGVQCVEKLKYAVECFDMERQRMLMVMIPGTDHTSWNDHEYRIAHQPPDILDQKVDNEVDRAGSASCRRDGRMSPRP